MTVFLSVVKRIWILPVLILLSPVLKPENGYAQILSPGELAKAHRHLEGIDNCTQCHSSEKEIDPEKCLTCHKSIGTDWKAETGYHGWLKKNEKKTCIQCHSDHNGLSFEMVRWIEKDRKKLDHLKTGYELTGRHKEIKCESCHQGANLDKKQLAADESIKSPDTFLALTDDCLSCHFDEHRESLGTKCGDCHDAEDWKKAPKFDHQKSDYPLTGRHQTVDCADCHKPVKDEKVFRKKPDKEYLQMDDLKFKSCLSCHQTPHPKEISEDCESCHTTGSWKTVKSQVRFNHDPTGYPLTGKHSNLECAACHFQEIQSAKSKTENLVIGNFLKKKMEFKLCTDCHADGHQKQLLKNGKLQPCEDCHTTTGFKPSVFTVKKHDSTQFPLTGAHQVTACTDCHHKSGSDPWKFSPLESDCQACHPDIHQGEADRMMPKTASGKPDCEFCHSTDTWKVSRFDHSKTDYPLVGGHLKVSCTDCHHQDGRDPGTVLFKTGMGKDCNSCHEDVHSGQFLVKGKTDCTRCHTEDNWIASRFDHNRDSQYLLDGAHQAVPCNGCHKPETQSGKTVIRFKPMETTCESCHGS